MMSIFSFHSQWSPVEMSAKGNREGIEAMLLLSTAGSCCVLFADWAVKVRQKSVCLQLPVF